MILSPAQINRERRNINKTKLDTASLRFPPLQGPCGSWAQAVKGGDCAAAAISSPMAKAEFLRPWLRVWQGKWCFSHLPTIVQFSCKVSNSKGPSFQGLGEVWGFLYFSSWDQTCSQARCKVFGWLVRLFFFFRSLHKTVLVQNGLPFIVSVTHRDPFSLHLPHSSSEDYVNDSLLSSAFFS